MRLLSLKMKMFGFHLLVATLAFSAAVYANAQEVSDKTVWDGIYSADQAARGKIVYEASCAVCHSADLTGSDQGRPLAGDPFKQDWMEDTVGNLYSRMSRLMPFEEPGSLNDQAYLDVLAYILEFNLYPVGSEELTTDGLDEIRIEGPDGPGPVPSFALVQVLGCLTRMSGNNWSLTSGTEPVRTREPSSSSSDELASLQSVTGPHTFALLNVYPSPDDSEGHQVEVKGLLIRLPERTRINVSSVSVIGPSCEP